MDSGDAGKESYVLDCKYGENFEKSAVRTWVYFIIFLWPFLNFNREFNRNIEHFHLPSGTNCHSTRNLKNIFGGLEQWMFLK